MLSQDDFFDFEGYLKWQTDRFSQDNEFIRQLLTTQAFNQFVESRDIDGKIKVESAIGFFKTN